MSGEVVVRWETRAGTVEVSRERVWGWAPREVRSDALGTSAYFS